MPTGFIIDLILSSLLYAILVLLTYRLTKGWRPENRRGNNDDDEGDGGVPVWPDDIIDLPPGVVPPGDTHDGRKKNLKEEEVMV